MAGPIDLDTEATAATGRLIVVSNRIPKGDVPAGGLVFALDEVLKSSGGIWLGAADPTETADDKATSIGSDPYERMTFSLTEAEYRGFYLRFSNAVLWPLFHHRTDLLEFHDGDFDAYAVVNARVARVIASISRPEDIIWIHDYHFLMIAAELRKLKVENRIGLFLHIPFPNTGDVLALPQAASLAEWLAAYDLVGLQTERDVHAAEGFIEDDGNTQKRDDGTWVRNGRPFGIAAFPIGIDAEGFAKAAASASEPDLLLEPYAPLLIGVDRLDYSKGLVHRFEAFGEYLSRREYGEMRPTFIQIAPVSREDVAAYQEIREELEQTAGSINGACGDLDWTPIRYVSQHVDRDQIAGLLRRADVALVTPLADGMNLVAKEFIAAQDAENPGVLILSHFAGASEQMQEALLVNPFDADSFATVIGQALNMPLDERKARYEALRVGVFEQNVDWWTGSFLSRLIGRSNGNATISMFDFRVGRRA